MKILFVNLSGLVFNVATPDQQPLGGTESALCYLARALAKRGHGVTMACKQPEASPEMVLDVRHVPLSVLLTQDFVASENFDAIIVSCTPVAGPSLRNMAPNALILLWEHLAPDHAFVRHLGEVEARDAFDGFVYVSRWQHKISEEYFRYQKPAAIMGNGFAPAFENMFSSAAELRIAKQNRAAYTTTPFRGLPVLIDVMNGLGTETYLDIYSSMKVYQSAAHDDQYAPLYAYAAANSYIANHGAVAQAELAERLKPVAFFTYPSIYPETFCIAALEARAAGLKVLTTASAALPEVLGAAAEYVAPSLEQPQQLIREFRALLGKNVDEFLRQPEAWAEQRFADLHEVNRNCTWDARAKIWERILVRSYWV